MSKACPSGRNDAKGSRQAERVQLRPRSLGTTATPGLATKLRTHQWHGLQQSLAATIATVQANTLPHETIGITGWRQDANVTATRSKH